jgi:hypothetical protein
MHMQWPARLLLSAEQSTCAVLQLAAGYKQESLASREAKQSFPAAALAHLISGKRTRRAALPE